MGHVYSSSATVSAMQCSQRSSVTVSQLLDNTWYNSVSIHMEVVSTDALENIHISLQQISRQLQSVLCQFCQTCRETRMHVCCADVLVVETQRIRREMRKKIGKKNHSFFICSHFICPCSILAHGNYFVIHRKTVSTDTLHNIELSLEHQSSIHQLFFYLRTMIFMNWC